MIYSKPLASCRSPKALHRPDRSKQCHCLQFAKCIVGLLHCYKSLWPLCCDSTIVLAVARLGVPATTATHSGKRLRRELTNLPPSGSSISSTSVAVQAMDCLTYFFSFTDQKSRRKTSLCHLNIRLPQLMHTLLMSRERNFASNRINR